MKQILIVLAFLLFQGKFFFTCAQTIDHWESVVVENDTWKYLVPSVAPATGWNQLPFNDASWNTGQASIGYGDSDDLTTLINGTISVYMRKTFSILDTAAIEKMILHVDYDDGFVAYLNGVEIARSNMSGTPPIFTDLATAQHEALLYQGGIPDQYVINKSQFAGLLLPGNNVLCLQVHNQAAGSSDLTALAVLSLGINNSSNNYFATPVWFVPPFEFDSSNLPIFVMNTNGQTIQDNVRIVIDLGVIYNGIGVRNFLTDPFNGYDGKISIELRGSSSQSFPKKGYSFETQDAAGNNYNFPLLDLPLENDWVLHGPYSDKSLMRNALAYHMGELTGQYAPRTRFCELMIDGDYKGVYLLVEKIKRDANRVDIATLNPADTTGDELTGGYIMKIDKWTGGNTQAFPSLYAPYSGASQTVNILYHYPDENDILSQQQNYIQQFMASFENNLNGPNFKDPLIGFRAYADEHSFMDFLIVNEMSRNVDGYRLSSYFYKDKNSNDSLLHMGPLWDFNLGFGNANYCAGSDTTGWAYDFYQVCNGDPWQIPFWWKRMMEDTTFNNDLTCRYLNLRQNKLSDASLTNWIDSVASVLGESQTRNFQRWNILGTYVWPNQFVGNTYQQEIDYLRSWVIARAHWMDAHMPGNCPNVGIDEKATNYFITAYPNPTEGDLFLVHSVEDAGRLTWTIKDVSGREVLSVPSNGRTTMVNTTGFSSGMYFVTLKDESDLYKTMKIMVR